MAKLKDLFLEIEDDAPSSGDDAIEVYADSVKQALELAAVDLNLDVTMLDYEIVKKGTKGLFGLGRQPYVVLIKPFEVSDSHDDLDELEHKLSSEHMVDLSAKESKNKDGSFKIRVTKSGIYLTSYPSKGSGKAIDIMEINNKLYSMRLTETDMGLVEKIVKKSSGEPQKIGEWAPDPQNDGAMRIEVSEDEMKSFAYFTPPRYAGRHMEYDEVLDALKRAGVVVGVKEEEVKAYLNEMNYTQPLVAAQGTKAKNGNDAFVDFKVNVNKSDVSFSEDEHGKVDFKKIDILENVVVGQILAVKIPAEEGIPGRTVTNKILPAKSGKESSIQYGKGTILSEDGTELTAEINGQVVFKGNKISVEPVYVVNGDVSLETGNIIFLGSVIVSGSVQDNFVVKAAGNIEVKGTVQKAFLEAEGDIIVHQGISGREEAKIESTGGNIFAKFVQNANVVAEKDVVVPEGILHSNVDSGSRIICFGKRARIVGGLIRATNEINARFIGADVSTKTELRVGINPKILQQMSDLDTMKNSIEEEVTQIRLDLKTLKAQKAAGKISGDKAKMLEDYVSREEKLGARLDEISAEIEELNTYLSMLEHKGKICAERSTYPGVDIYIKDQSFKVKDEYKNIKFSLEGGEIRLSEYEPPEEGEGKSKLSTIVQSRRGR